MHWDGTAWSLVPAEQQTVYGETLESIKAIFPNNVWAVGHYCPGAPAACRTLTEHWDGSAWSAYPSPNNALDGDYLNDLAVVSIDDMWAVGFSLVPGPPPYGNHAEPLTMRWDGSAWSIVPAAIPAGYGGALEGVAAIGPDDVWAVGGYGPLGGYGQTLTMHWNGLAWSIVPSPSSGPYSSTLKAVGVVSPTEVWAVGEGSLSTLAMRWNGSGWSVVSSPSAPGTNFVHGLAIAAANDMVMAGYSYDGAIHELLLRWNGAQWTPEQGSHAGGYFYGVTALSGGDFWGGGMRGYADNTTLVEQFGLAEPFSDVSAADYFFDAVRHLYCAGAISGYADGTFRPYNNTTRGQLAKIVTLAEGWEINTTGGPHFSDVGPGSAFYNYVETAYNRGVISGYADGTFRPDSDVTRGQLCKIVVLAEGWPINTTGGPHFTDVPAGSVFYGFIETAFNRGIITGYSDGTFRPGNPATRGQIAKIVYNAVSAP
jgi:hypothetical protein